MGTERGQSAEDGDKMSTQHVLNGTYQASTCIIPGSTAVCSKGSTQRRTKQHRNAGQSTAPHGTATALRCAAELHIAGLS